MILQALTELYARYPEGTLPPEGYEDTKISFVLVVERDGDLVDIFDVREGEGKRKHGRFMRVPQACDRPGQGAWQTAFLLWDHPRYVLGLPPNDTQKEMELAPKRLRSFIDRIKASFPDPETDDGVNAVLKFYEQGGIDKAKQHPRFQDLVESNGNIAFQLAGDIGLVAQRAAVSERVAWEFANPEEAALAQCLVTGEIAPLSRLHPATPVRGSQATAKIHSFNLDAFNSYGKDQGANAPVSEAAAFRYTTALNHLLETDRLHIQVGDTSAVFWADVPHDLESAIPDLFGDPPKDDPDRNVRAVEALYSAVQAGRFTEGGPDTRFHVLGLAPNAARISIRFWETATAANLAIRIKQHFDDIKVVHADFEPRYLSLFRLLTGVALLNKADNIPPNLGGEVIRAILEGLPYPAQLLNLAVVRCRAEQKPTYARAAAIKASLNRLIRSRKTHEKEFLPMLDLDNTSPAYKMGRLFAVLEKIQEESAGGTGKLNATIRDRYYGAASSSPASVFPLLLKLKNHHISKLDERGSKMLYRAFNDNRPDQYIGQVLEHVSDIPKHLALPDQGRFALGYYHQRQAFFTKSESKNQEESQ